MATIWPVVYMALFFATGLSVMFLLAVEGGSTSRSSENIDLIQLVRKIKNNELKQLTVKPSEIVALDRVGDREYHTAVTNESTRAEILKEAQALNANGQPQVPKIEDETSQPSVSPLFPVGMVALFGAHLFTIILVIALMPLYIILAVKSERLDQTMKIVWAVLICTAGMFVMPVYWYLYIWRDARPTATVATADNIEGKLSL